MRNVLDKSCRENKNTHFIFNNFFRENRTVNEIMSKNTVETEWPQVTPQYGAYALCAELAYAHASGYSHARTHAHAVQHVILIAFHSGNGFPERASKFRYKYIACLVIIRGNATCKAFCMSSRSKCNTLRSSQFQLYIYPLKTHDTVISLTAVMGCIHRNVSILPIENVTCIITTLPFHLFPE
jgi:hypothetical protein